MTTGTPKMTTMKASALAHPRFKANPYPFYARMRAENPVFQASIPIIGRGWFVTRYDDVVTVAKDDRFSRDIQPLVRWLPALVRVPLTRQMLSQDPPDHTRLRRLVSQAFTPRRVDRLRDRIQIVCDERLEAASRRASFDLVRHYALPIPLTVIAELLGIPTQDRQRFHRLAQGTLPIGVASGMLDIPMALPYVWLITRYFRRLFAERRARAAAAPEPARAVRPRAGPGLSRHRRIAALHEPGRDGDSPHRARRRDSRVCHHPAWRVGGRGAGLGQPRRVGVRAARHARPRA